jgi:arsenical pump membrane protein
MRELIACSSFALTVTLAIGRPHIGRRWQVGPASASLLGVFCLVTAGIVHPADIGSAAVILWRPFVTILSIMITTAAAQRLGVLDCLAKMMFTRADLPVDRLFLRVFVLSVATAALLNNDAAVLLLTPLVLALVRDRYPRQPRLLVPFAFGVFMAAGVAPFVVSNPMNMIVASYAGLNFNTYAASMLPISLVGWVLAFVLLRRLFTVDLATDLGSSAVQSPRSVSLNGQQRLMLGLLVLVLGSYPIVASIDGSAIWIVSAVGAAAALGVVCWRGQTTPADVLARGVAWNILVFLPAVFILAVGLRNVGLVDFLRSVYEGVGFGVIGATAALGSAGLNNHPMAMMNMLALGGLPDVGHREYLAALIGGDLGPRLLPMGSLAGLLWLESCRRLGVEISLGQFVRVGLLLTVPTLAISLLMLSFI